MAAVRKSHASINSKACDAHKPNNCKRNNNQRLSALRMRSKYHAISSSRLNESVLNCLAKK
jgi:hypothetical protein